jgi:hypothetical protein
VPNGSAAGGILFVLVAAIAIGTFIGAIILMVAIGLYNLLAGKDRVPAVGMQHAMTLLPTTIGRAFLVTLCHAIITFVLIVLGVAAYVACVAMHPA